MLKNIKLEHVDVPQGCTEIDTNAFYGMTSLKSVTIPNTVTLIRNTAFALSGIEELIIPEGNISLSSSLCQRCTNLKKVVIPNSTIRTSGGSQFSGCSALTDVTIGTGLTSLPNEMFRDCTSLASIEIPANITSISNVSNQQTFFGCTNLEKITINKPEGSISGAPWGAPETTQVIWTG